jgi:hypothetical protein
MPVLVLMLAVGLGQRNELIAQVDEGLAPVLGSQLEVEDPALEGQRLLDVAHLERDMVHAHQFRAMLLGTGMSRHATISLPAERLCGIASGLMLELVSPPLGR